jgi:membrane associated rhomboid family serine protease
MKELIQRNDKQITWRAAALLGFVGAMWLIYGMDTFLPEGQSVAGHGVIPRTWAGLNGILTAPLIHANLQHLVSNTLPLLILGAMVLLRGINELLFVTLVGVLTSGLGKWLFGSSGNHIGASGIIFAYMGYLLFRSAFDRKISSIVVTLLVAFAYGSAMAVGLLPREGVSWSGHFFGLLGGFLAARLRYPHRDRNQETIDATLSALQVRRRP